MTLNISLMDFLMCLDKTKTYLFRFSIRQQSHPRRQNPCSEVCQDHLPCRPWKYLRKLIHLNIQLFPCRSFCYTCILLWKSTHFYEQFKQGHWGVRFTRFLWLLHPWWSRSITPSHARYRCAIHLSKFPLCLHTDIFRNHFWVRTRSFLK